MNLFYIFKISDQQSVCLPSITTPLEITTNGKVQTIDDFTIVKTCLCSYISVGIDMPKPTSRIRNLDQKNLLYVVKSIQTKNIKI